MTGLARLTLIPAVLSAVLFAVLGLVAETALKPAGLDPFDSRVFGYGPEAARDYLKALEEAGGTRTYLGVFRQLDTVFPVLLAASFAGAIWVNCRALGLGVPLLLIGAPLGYLLADLVENARVARMLMIGEGVSDLAVEAASWATRAKWLCVGLSLLFILAAWGQRRMQERAGA